MRRGASIDKDSFLRWEISNKKISNTPVGVCVCVCVRLLHFYESKYRFSIKQNEAFRRFCLFCLRAWMCHTKDNNMGSILLIYATFIWNLIFVLEFAWRSLSILEINFHLCNKNWVLPIDLWCCEQQIFTSTAQTKRIFETARYMLKDVDSSIERNVYTSKTLSFKKKKRRKIRNSYSKHIITTLNFI